MAAVMALQHQWFQKDAMNISSNLDFNGMQDVPHIGLYWTLLILLSVNNNIHGLIRSVNDGSTSAFMWEWFTTKPWIDRGEARFVCFSPTFNG